MLGAVVTEVGHPALAMHLAPGAPSGEHPGSCASESHVRVSSQSVAGKAAAGLAVTARCCSDASKHFPRL